MKFRVYFQFNRKVDFYEVKSVPLQEPIRCKKWQFVTLSDNTK